ncbi:MAG TPA: SurA N-terminal domain-containing protein [Steroidobacteraceae bacterium]|nr:SurA N-terminal domain-containing protein [Steroidobacteraceae bacterium]
MLQKIHDKLTGWVAYVILGGVAAVFVLWGINWTLGAPDYAAKVNGSAIPANEVREAYQRQLAKLERADNGTVDDATRNALKRRVLDEFVAEEALITRVQSLGYRVRNADVLAAEAQIPAFQVAGKFDPDHAVALLQAEGRSIAQVESEIRRQIQLQQLDDAMRISAFATPTEVDRVEALMHEQRDIGWITIAAAPFVASATPTDADLQAYYEAHRRGYMTPETVDLRYIELSLEKIAAGIPVTDAQLHAYFEDQKAKNPQNFVQPEERRVSHILIAVTNPKDDAAAKAQAEAVFKRAESGEDFAKLAKEYSQDPGSAKQGGDLGWNDRKSWVTPFADAAFSMKVGQIMGPVKTRFGYHILKLVGIRPAAVETFEQSKAALEAQYRRSRADETFNHLEDKLADAALQNPTDIDAAARKTGLPVQVIAGFTRATGGGAFLNLKPVIDAAFSPDVLDGNLSSLVQVSKDDAIVVLATNHQLPRQKPLAAVRGDVIAAWKKQRGAELALAAAEAARKQLVAGATWPAVAKSLHVPPQLPRFVAREDPSVPLTIRRDAFEAPKPDLEPYYRATSLSDGDAVVFGLDAVRQDPNASGTDKPLIARELAMTYASAEAQAYAAAARADAKVVLNPKAID